MTKRYPSRQWWFGMMSGVGIGILVACILVEYVFGVPSIGFVLLRSSALFIMLAGVFLYHFGQGGDQSSATRA
jgi:hypothetical protein